MTKEAAAPTLREAIARFVYEAMAFEQPQWVPWVERGNSHAQERAGDAARDIAALAARPADPVEPTSVFLLKMPGMEWEQTSSDDPRGVRFVRTTPVEPPTLPSSRERWNAENPGELSLHTFDDDATPALPKEPTARPRTSPSGAQEMCGRDV